MIRLSAPLAALGLVTLIGCGPGEQVNSYKVPRSTEKGAPAEGKGSYRMLGAMYPADQPTWFFKLSGTTDELAAQEAAFHKFLTSVKFPKGPDAPPAYDLPEGWKSEGARGMRADTIRIGSLELTVIKAMGGAKENVDRWAGQLGGKANFENDTKPVTTADGVKGLRVDLAGPENPADTAAPFMRGR